MHIAFYLELLTCTALLAVTWSMQNYVRDLLTHKAKREPWHK